MYYQRINSTDQSELCRMFTHHLFTPSSTESSHSVCSWRARCSCVKVSPSEIYFCPCTCSRYRTIPLTVGEKSHLATERPLTIFYILQVIKNAVTLHCRAHLCPSPHSASFFKHECNTEKTWIRQSTPVQV